MDFWMNHHTSFLFESTLGMGALRSPPPETLKGFPPNPKPGQFIFGTFPALFAAKKRLQ
jgi:hypothetical protein